MLPKTHPLIEAATEPLADNAEKRLGANAMLEKNFDAKHPDLEGVTLRLQAASRRRFLFVGKALAWLLAAVALATVVHLNMPTVRIAETMLDLDLFEPIEKPPLPEGLDEEARLILGDPELPDLEQKRRLHEFDPENPAYFAEYANTYASEDEALPPDFFETVSSIDPDNSFFIYFAAGRLGAKSFEKKRSSQPPSKPRFADGVRLRPNPREMEADIKDEEAFGEALALVAKAGSMPDFETYNNPMMAARVRLLPVENTAEFIRSLFYAYGPSPGLIHLRYVSDLLSARAEQLSKEGRKEEFVELAAQRDAFIAHLARNPDINFIGELVYSVIASNTATNFRFAAERLDLAELGKKYRSETEAFQKHRDMEDIRREKDPDDFPEEKASMFAGPSLPVVGSNVNSPPKISGTDLRPMRMVEHELIGKTGLFAVGLCLTLSAVVIFSFRFIFPPIVRLPAIRLSDVLGTGDRIRVVGLGMLLPVVLFLIITRLTPLGGRGYGSHHFMFAFPGVHLVALLLSLLIAPAVVVRLRLTKRLAPLGLGDRFTVPVALAALAILLAWSLAALPFLVHMEMSERTWLMLAAPPAFCLSLIFFHALRSILGSPASRITQCATASGVLPIYAVAVVVLCLLTPIHSAAESHWIARDTMFRIDPDAADLGAYEFKVAARKREETNAILGFE